MGLIQRFKSAFRAFGLTFDDVAKMLLRGGTTSSGISVSSDTAMRCSTVFSCVNILSRSISQLPCHLYKQTGPNKDKTTDHPLYPLLHDQPNEWMTAPEFWGMCMAQLALRGNFYALKNRGTNRLTGQIRELIPLAPGIVQQVKQDENYRLTYKCQFPDGKLIDIPGTEIMHLRGLTLNGYMGMNPIEYVRESIGLAMASEEFGARYYGNGINPGVIIEHPQKLSTNAKDNLLKGITEAYGGLGKSHRWMLLEEGMKATPISIKPQDAQFLESRKYQKADIVDIFFSMPLTLMASEGGFTYTGPEQFSLNFVTYALQPWITAIEKGIRRDLLSDAEKQSHYAKFQVGALLRGDMLSRFQAYAVGIDKEILNPNECRDLEDMNPYTGGEIYKTRTSTTKEPAPGQGDKNAV